MPGRPAALLALFLLLPASAGAAAKEVPFLAGRVNDQANLLTPEQRQRIEGKLAEFERQTTNQIVVLTVQSLEGDPIEDYALRVAEAWKLGTAEKDNGALLLVASGDRKMRIEVGYGLEPQLTDLQTNIIQNDVIIPYFKRGNFGDGIEAGVDAMISTVQGKDVTPAAPAPRPSGGGGGDGGFLIFLLFLLFPFSLDALRSRSWLLYVFLMPFYFFLGYIIAPILGVIALGAWIVLYPILRMVVPKSSSRSFGRRGGGGWFIGPGMGGGGGGWGGGGGGGFSGGGGSFGGGGSSSSW